MIPPGSWLGLLGGGQLGRMFAMAAQSLGYRVMVLDPGTDSPAGSVADAHIQADYLDEAGLGRLAEGCLAITTEFENVPAASLAALASRRPVRPGADSVAVAQDRIREKVFLSGIGIAVAPYAVIRSAGDIKATDPALFPGILKRSWLGYDGKGQARVSTPDKALRIFREWAEEPCVLEQALAIGREVSIIVCRGDDGATVTYPVVENSHIGGILDITVAPARITPELHRRAIDWSLRIADELGYCGVLCVEFFVLEEGTLLVNEIAPRPHNSGHYTLDACVTSQFEQQARILADLPLGNCGLHCPAVMVNLLGDLWAAGEPRWEKVLRHSRAKLHLYGKREARPGRKMGHFTVLGEDSQTALELAQSIQQELVADSLAGRANQS